MKDITIPSHPPTEGGGRPGLYSTKRGESSSPSQKWRVLHMQVPHARPGMNSPARSGSGARQRLPGVPLCAGARGALPLGAGLVRSGGLPAAASPVVRTPLGLHGDWGPPWPGLGPGAGLGDTRPAARAKDKGRGGGSRPRCPPRPQLPALSLPNGLLGECWGWEPGADSQPSYGRSF